MQWMDDIHTHTCQQATIEQKQGTLNTKFKKKFGSDKLYKDWFVRVI